MSDSVLICIGLGATFLLGLLGFCVSFNGYRRGEIKYRGEWHVRGHDLTFWLIILTIGIGSLAGMAFTLLEFARIFWN